MTHTEVNITSATIGDNAPRFVLISNPILKTASAIIVPPLSTGHRATPILLIQKAFGDKEPFGCSSYTCQAGYRVSYVVYWNKSEGTIYVKIVENTWGLAAVSCKLFANSILYRS